MYAHLPLPDARRQDPENALEDVAALLRLIRSQCLSPEGKVPTMEQVGALVGVSDSALYAYLSTPKGRKRPPMPGYPLLYALRALVAAPKDARALLWGACE